MKKFKTLFSILALPIATIASVACSTTNNNEQKEKEESKSKVETTITISNQSTSTEAEINTNANTNTQQEEFSFEKNREPFMNSITIVNKEFLKGLNDGESKLYYDRVGKKFYDKPTYNNPDKKVILEQDTNIYTFKNSYDSSTKEESSLRANSNGEHKSQDDVIISKNGNTITLKLWLSHYIREASQRRGQYIQDTVELTKEFTLD
ncbi:hypothetical protein [Mycoplasma sp. CSL7503-lung]|uniref:hypothetical protein n=1 Tax=Mycoplasma sp. CSL7503-lung TaxID=536372 RepID=UPI0021D2D413|nr:hypothetical protein [Mycoplasma sp. CSL7503-lung]MCU4706801.1 hypothetical protein [Mycoplasma sp. CSL7503-lung]